jgi:hypothetical protein
MDLLLQSLTQRLPLTLLALALGLIASLGFSLFLYLRMRNDQRRWRQLLTGSTGSSLETMLRSHFDERISLEARVDSLETRADRAEELLKSSKRFLGLVRFDAFPDVGGSQSFALALFDDQGDGAVLSSIVGRNSCRVYCKPIVGGRSERDLSQEEQRAMRSATEGGVRLILSP